MSRPCEVCGGTGRVSESTLSSDYAHWVRSVVHHLGCTGERKVYTRNWELMRHVDWGLTPPTSAAQLGMALSRGGKVLVEAGWTFRKNRGRYTFERIQA